MANELVLLFEDNDGVADFFKDIVETHGYRVNHYLNPADFFAQKEEAARQLEKSALIWTDGEMPKMHGLDLTRKLRLEHAYNKPIVYNSGRLADREVTDIEAQTVTRADGSSILLVNKVLIKPVDLKTIYKTLDTLLAPKP